MGTARRLGSGRHVRGGSKSHDDTQDDAYQKEPQQYHQNGTPLRSGITRQPLPSTRRDPGRKSSQAQVGPDRVQANEECDTIEHPENRLGSFD